MKWIKFKMIIIFIAILYSKAVNAIPDQVLRSGTFLIRYDLRDEKTAIHIDQLLKRFVPRLEEFFSVKMRQPILLVIASSKMNFRKLHHGRIPNWAGAVYITSNRSIVVKSPRWSGSLFDLDVDVLHELSHFFFDQAVDNDSVPLWFNEGLAMLLSGRKMGLRESLMLSNALWAKRVIPLTEIDSLLFFNEKKARLAYIQSLSAVLFLQNRLKDYSLQRFLHGLPELGWSRAFVNFVGMDEVDFELRWYRHVQTKYRWLIILNVENILWVSAILILLLSMYAIRYRNRKRLKEWEIEEQLGNIPVSGDLPYPMDPDNNFRKRGE